jgi:hypothetical protein
LIINIINATIPRFGVASRQVEAKSKSPDLPVNRKMPSWNVAFNPTKAEAQCRQFKGNALKAIAQGNAL